MFTYYRVRDLTFAHYGTVYSFARRMGTTVDVVKTNNIFKVMYASI